MNHSGPIDLDNNFRKENISSVTHEILLVVMQNNIDFGFKNYSEVITKFKQITNNSDRRIFLEGKLFELKEMITNQKPVVKSFLLAFPTDWDKIYDLLFSPLTNFKDFLEEKIALIDEFHSDKSKKSLGKSKNANAISPDNMALEELKTYIDNTVKLAAKNTPEAPKSDHEVLLRRSDVAKLFSVSVVTVSEWTKSGRLKSYRINSRVFFKKDEVMAAMKERGRKK